MNQVGMITDRQIASAAVNYQNTKEYIKLNNKIGIFTPKMLSTITTNHEMQTP